MQTDALKLAEQHARDGQTERLSWGMIEFQVTDLDSTVAFWTTALGLCVRDQDTGWVSLGTQTKTFFVFHAGASKPASARHLGLYHVAIGMPDQYEFSRLMARLNALQVPAAPIDHLMSKAIYITDPDGLEIEIAFETPERFGRFGDMSREIVLYDANGQAHSGRAPLDTSAELDHAKGADLVAPLSDDAFVAHMHFKVADLESATKWYEGIGFARNLMLPEFGLADMGTGSAYTHRLAMNIWAGPNLEPAPDDMARLTRYALYANDTEVITRSQGLRPTHTGLHGRDPTGTEMSVLFPPSNHLQGDS